MITRLAALLTVLDNENPTRVQITNSLLDCLYEMGIISYQKTISQLKQISASCFSRRRLAVMLVRLRMVSNIRLATRIVKRGYIRVGSQIIIDPGFLMTRSSVGRVSWVEG